MNDNLYLRLDCIGVHRDLLWNKTNKNKKLRNALIPRSNCLGLYWNLLSKYNAAFRACCKVRRINLHKSADQCHQHGWVQQKDKDNQRRKYDFTCCACTLYNSVDKCQQHGCRMSWPYYNCKLWQILHEIWKEMLSPPLSTSTIALWC